MLGDRRGANTVSLKGSEVIWWNIVSAVIWDKTMFLSNPATFYTGGARMHETTWIIDAQSGALTVEGLQQSELARLANLLSLRRDIMRRRHKLPAFRHLRRLIGKGCAYYKDALPMLEFL